MAPYVLTSLNKKQKILTILALISFLMIGAAHMCVTSTWYPFKKYEWVKYERAAKPYISTDPNADLPGHVDHTNAFADLIPPNDHPDAMPVHDATGKVKEWRYTDWRNEVRLGVAIP